MYHSFAMLVIAVPLLAGCGLTGSHPEDVATLNVLLDDAMHKTPDDLRVLAWEIHTLSKRETR